MSLKEVQEKLEASQGVVAQELRKDLGRAEERLRELRQDVETKRFSRDFKRFSLFFT